MSYRGLGVDPFPTIPGFPEPGSVPVIPSSIPGFTIPGSAPAPGPAPLPGSLQMTQAELLAFLQLMNTKKVQGHTIRVVKPELVSNMAPQQKIMASPGQPLSVHGIGFSNVAVGRPSSYTGDKAPLHSFISDEKAKGNGLVVSLTYAGGTGAKPTGSNVISTRNVAKVAALNAADPTSFVLYEPSAGWVTAGGALPGQNIDPVDPVDPVDPGKKTDPAAASTEPNYVLWAAGAAAVVVGLAIVSSK